MRFHPVTFITQTGFIIALAACGGETPSLPNEAVTSADSGFAASATSRADVAGWIHVPGGTLVHPSCVHVLPDGASIDEGHRVVKDGKVLAHYDACAYSPIASPKPGETPRPQGVLGTGNQVPNFMNGVIEYSQYSLPDTVPSAPQILGWDGYVGGAGAFTVPSPPTTYHGQTIFLAQGVVGSGWSLQVALQWGQSATPTELAPNGAYYPGNEAHSTLGSAQGGQYWQLASWATDIFTGNVYMSYPIPVKEGDEIIGGGMPNAPGTTCNGGTSWAVEGMDATLESSTLNPAPAFQGILGIVCNAGPFYTALAGILEVYGVTECSDLPAAGFELFTPPVVRTTGTGFESVTWTAKTQVASNAAGSNCTIAASIESNGGTSLAY